jgi:hypothetical protein
MRLCLGAPKFRVFPVNDAHHHIVMPNPIDEGRLALSSLDDKPTFLISADRSRIVLNHPNGKPMQLENIECIFQHNTDRFRTEALSKLSPVFNTDR